MDGQIKATYEDFDLSFEGGESSREATQRIVQVVEDLLRNRAGNTIIVSHGNILSLLLKYFNHSFGFEQWGRMTNPDVYLLMVSNEQYHDRACLEVKKQQEAAAFGVVSLMCFFEKEFDAKTNQDRSCKAFNH